MTLCDIYAAGGSCLTWTSNLAGGSYLTKVTDRERGQATVEFALLLPFIFLMLLVLVQVGLLAHTRLLVTRAVREAVREAAVGSPDDSVKTAAVLASDLDASRLKTKVIRSGDRVSVKLSYTDTTSVPFIGRFVGDVVLSARATMRLESGP